jgi:hypothetical protein
LDVGALLILLCTRVPGGLEAGGPTRMGRQGGFRASHKGRSNEMKTHFSHHHLNSYIGYDTAKGKILDLFL